MEENIQSDQKFTTEEAKKTDWGKVRYISSWVVLIVLFPFTIAVLLSQNALPGETFYPLKRSIENVVLAAASVNPVTKAAFRTDLASRRFKEAETLLLSQKNVSGLNDFVLEIEAAQQDLSTISDPVKKQELTTKVNNSLTEFDTRLLSVRTQLSQESQSASQPQPSSIPTQPTILVPTIVPTSLALSPTKPVQQPTPTVFVPSPTQVSPTSIPTLVPSFPPSTGTTSTDPVGRVDEVRDYIRCLQTHPVSQCVAPTQALHELRNEKKREQEKEERRDQQRDQQEEFLDKKERNLKTTEKEEKKMRVDKQ